MREEPNNGLPLAVRSASLRSAQRPSAEAVAVGRRGRGRAVLRQRGGGRMTVSMGIKHHGSGAYDVVPIATNEYFAQCFRRRTRSARYV